MIVVRRNDYYNINIKDRFVNVSNEHKKYFSEYDFFEILFFLSGKGLKIEVPSIISGSDATFIYKKLSDTKNHDLGRTAAELALFIYMRLDNKTPLQVDFELPESQRTRHK